MRYTKIYEGIELLELANKKELPANVYYRDRYGNFYFSSGGSIIHICRFKTAGNKASWVVPTYLDFLGNDFTEVESCDFKCYFL